MLYEPKDDLMRITISLISYKNCYFIVVSKKHIKCITYGELMQDKVVSPTSHNYLGNRREFELDKEVSINLCEFGIKFFNGVCC